MKFNGNFPIRIFNNHMLLDSASSFTYTVLPTLKKLAAFAMFFLLFRRIYYSNVKHRLKNLFLRIKKGSVRLFRVAAGRKNHQQWVWNELKKYHKKQEFYYGVYEGTNSVLASHLNSIVSAGRVVVNVQENRVEYNLEKDLTLFAIYP
ncbi:MAG: hypothetical protein NBV77_05840 [Bacteroidia bacterium]|nr:hypothetical protein [Bacteroidia bacterium]